MRAGSACAPPPSGRRRHADRPSSPLGARWGAPIGAPCGATLVRAPLALHRQTAPAVPAPARPDTPRPLPLRHSRLHPARSTTWRRVSEVRSPPHRRPVEGPRGVPGLRGTLVSLPHTEPGVCNRASAYRQPARATNILPLNNPVPGQPGVVDFHVHRCNRCNLERALRRRAPAAQHTHVVGLVADAQLALGRRVLRKPLGSVLPQAVLRDSRASLRINP